MINDKQTTDEPYMSTFLSRKRFVSILIVVFIVQYTTYLKHLAEVF